MPNSITRRDSRTIRNQIGDDSGPEQVRSLPGYGDVKTKQIAGAIPIGSGAANLFFWLVESAGDPKHDPLVLWLNGGPGASSFIGFFAENGPYRLSQKNDEIIVEDNPHSWHQCATYLMIDQPSGVGLSGITEPIAYAKNEAVATDQLYLMLVQLLTRCPEYRDLPLYICGESFCGHYLATLAHAILDGNKRGYAHLNFKGVALGNGWVDPLSMQQTWPEYAYHQGLICLNEKFKAEELYRSCEKAVRDTMPVPSAESDMICEQVEDYIAKVAGGINVYDVRIFGDYDYSLIGKYLDRSDVRSALHVGKSAGPWVSESKTVSELLEQGEQASVSYLYPRLFEELDVLIYNGIYDLDCNFIGTDRWLRDIKWSYGDEFNSRPRSPWSEDGRVVGHARSSATLTKSSGRLTQLIILNSGHLVPMDQPKVAYQMFERFITGRRFVEV